MAPDHTTDVKQLAIIRVVAVNADGVLHVWSSYVAPKSPKGGSKKQNGPFPSIIAILLKKVC